MNHEKPSRERGYEVSDVPVRGLLIAIAIIVIGVSGSLFVVRVMMLGPAPEPEEAGIAGQISSFTHGAAARSSIRQSWEELEAELTTRLRDDYGWVDRERKIVRIPIERAIDLIVREHAAPDATADDDDGPNAQDGDGVQENGTP